jgi:hypothetical protein
MRILSALCSATIVTSFLAVGVGCTTRSQLFDGYSDDQLWTAMVATARSPEYDNWKVSDNEVFLDDSSRRIEIYRVLKRTLVSPYSDPRREEAEWKFQVVLTRDEELDQPLIDFTARQLTVPAHVWDEADRYFQQMRTLLGPAKMTPTAIPNAPIDETPIPPPLDATPTTTEPEPTADPAAEPLPE